MYKSNSFINFIMSSNKVNYTTNDFRGSLSSTIVNGLGLVFGEVVSSPSEMFYENPRSPSRFFVTYVHNNLNVLSHDGETVGEYFGTQRVLPRENGSVLSFTSCKDSDRRRTTRVQYKNKRFDIPTKNYWVGMKTYSYHTTNSSSEPGDESDDSVTPREFIKCHGSSREWENYSHAPGQKIFSWSTLVNSLNSGGHDISPFVNFSEPRPYNRKSYIPNVGDKIAYSTYTGEWAVVSDTLVNSILFILSNKNIEAYFAKSTANKSFPLTSSHSSETVSYHNYIDQRIFNSAQFQTDPFGMWMFGLYNSCETTQELVKAFTLSKRNQLSSWTTISSSFIFEIEFSKSFDFYKVLLSIALKGDIPTLKNYPKHDRVLFNSLGKFYPFDYDKWMCNPSLVDRCLQAFSWGAERIDPSDFSYNPTHKKFFNKFNNFIEGEDEDEDIVEVEDRNYDCIDDDGNEVFITMSSWANIVKKSLEEKGLTPPTSPPSQVEDGSPSGKDKEEIIDQDYETDELSEF